MNSQIGILLVDDQVLFREALRTLLTVQEDFTILGEASNGEEAIRLATLKKPNVVLMDLRMPVMDGVTATKSIRNSLPKCNILILTTFDDDELVFDGLRAGAVGYLLKDVSADKLYAAIRSAAKGEYYLVPSIAAKVVAEFSRLPRPVVVNVDQAPIEKLSPREMEILNLVATGATNGEIATELVIAEGTVKNHVRSILGKLGARDRMQAVLKAKQAGLINF